jgi:hypothetical protein
MTIKKAAVGMIVALVTTRGGVIPGGRRPILAYRYRLCL